MSQTKERSYSIKQPKEENKKIEVVLEGVHGDISSMVDDILNPSSELGLIARSKTFILKTRGFSLLALREEFARKEACIDGFDEFFPIQASFNVEKKHYAVEFSDRKAFVRGQVI